MTYANSFNEFDIATELSKFAEFLRHVRQQFNIDKLSAGSFTKSARHEQQRKCRQYAGISSISQFVRGLSSIHIVNKLVRRQFWLRCVLGSHALLRIGAKLEIFVNTYDHGKNAIKAVSS